MAEDGFDDFDDFDEDVKNAVNAEEEGEQLEEAPELPKPAMKQRGRPALPTRVAQPTPATVATEKPRAASQPQRHAEQPRPAPAPSRAKEIVEPRFGAYTRPESYGLYDNESKQAYLEAESMDKLILALLVDIKNDVDEIKKSL